MKPGQKYKARVGNQARETAKISESIKERKTCKTTLEWKDQKKFAV